MKRIQLILIALLLLGGKAIANTYNVESPDSRIKLYVNTDESISFYVNLGNHEIIHKSGIGLVLDKGYRIGNQVKVVDVKTSNINEIIHAPFYRQDHFQNQYHELKLTFKNGFGITFRVFNEGIAYRFFNTKKKQIIIDNEIANYNFGKDKETWLPYTTNEKAPFAMAFQNIYDHTAIDKAEKKIAFLPATVNCGNAKVTILESDLVSYPGMFIIADGDYLKGVFAKYPKKMEYYPWRHMNHVAETNNYIAASTSASNYPWRVFAITEADTQMPVNNMVYALARPNKIGNTDWIHPGKVSWDWWNDWNLKGVDFKAGINQQTYKYYIDFASKNHIEYIVLDEGWYDSKSGDIMHPIKDLNLEELIEYGKKRNVGIVLWSVFNLMDENLENICRHYADMGIKGFKVDFMDRDDQTAVEMVERLAACTAKHHLILDLHGIYKPVGLNRTYPNIINYESVFGMEESRWTTIDHDMPLYDVTFPYIRMMAGQVDFTPGAMRNGTKNDWKANYIKPMSMGTRCHQAACYVVQDSPFTMLADSPTSYEADSTYTKYIADIPVVYNETIIPQGEIGKYIVTARRNGNKWYIAGQTNWDSRDITLQFSFLKSGVEYNARILKDGINADHDAEDYRIDKFTVNTKSSIKVHLASGGGFVIAITPKAVSE
ncbi:glycoside hydrolase family 97 protein [Segatella paludivivens]|uniref:glycoside hydrolase family 97 protein n=1 Tax=Segatella paludivivens TaxID=185294 RepID=UPI000360700D|nr:glycoside hydrolase family 97 protein [Segatella paludivivens]